MRLVLTLSPHILKAKDGPSVVVIRHPKGTKPNGLRHDAVYLAGRLTRSQKLSDAERVEQLLNDARRWIEDHAAAIDALPTLQGHGLIDRLKRHKKAWADSRGKTARLIKAARRGMPRPQLEAEFGAKAVSLIFAKWPRLRARYPKRTPKPRGGSQIKAGGDASRTLLMTLISLAKALNQAPRWEDLAALQTPPLSRDRIHRYLDLLRDSLHMEIQDEQNGPKVIDWGIINPDRI